ncbi:MULTISPECIES: dipeptide/oligopeptide/nickel ABC transporter permease/ATP-binding protein [unclassified Rathayibacter]|uniref:dipeptide/oligopeptide/nickel ABC transporter permease/ATP-binding protein n=1 Tax=unclassified Rathayibacter TaxID=2609250 RepID=UPI001048A633|nr:MULTISPECIES: dipeptide/oligopeptide/nickel ABC transporter permease/ATP-binding protein [unclassified Rathayibacter]MCJ1704305.1 dipeptide/oligopeptide/nickel ABC transporter permease/ATP-binding protein [Rathayibacter sp. VKM Ac-2926]TCL82988.1 ABC-type dipeptide/oligopeptide/nickel transport system ATPase component [Rathayibacter sp. PhB192]TCM28485.1 ABC-type dipeptide/oligopeptide/nickel transport system ATPase component [Rathayibacter sp. PhB179]
MSTASRSARPSLAHRLPESLRTPQGVAAAVGLVLVILATVLGPILFGDLATERSIADRQQGASLAHPFGTDDLGRDLLARVVVATRVSVLLTLGATGISVVGGVLLGVVAVLLPRLLQRLIAGLIDILLSFPWLLLALFFSVIWGTTAVGAMLAVGFAGIPVFARLTSTLAASVSSSDYVRAAGMLGSRPLRTTARHVVPNILPPLLVNSAAHASVTLLSFAALSFLGLGVQAPEYDWGRLLNEGAKRIYVDPMAAIGPGIAVVLVGVVFALLGEVFSESSSRRRPVKAVKRRRSDEVVAAVTDDMPVVEMSGLRVAFPGRDGAMTERVHGVDLTILPGETVGIVGESGSGKSVTASAVAGLLGPDALVTSEQLVFRGIDMTAVPNAGERRRLGLEQAMIFQDPLTSLNPALTIGRQLREASEVHARTPRAESLRRAIDKLNLVRIPDAEKRVGRLPHEFSGGMRQRAMIAMGLMGTPRLLIADEPTTALDVTVQRQVMQALREAQTATGAAILFISHDIALVSGFCDRIVVMRDGRVVEEIAADRLDEARHPYTRGLIACVPDMATDRSAALPVIAAIDEEPPSADRTAHDEPAHDLTAHDQEALTA